MRYCQTQHGFGGGEDLCKLGKEYLNALICKLNRLFSGQNFETFEISHAFLPLTVAKLSTLKYCPGFWPTLYSHRRKLNFCSLLPATRSAGAAHGLRRQTDHFREFFNDR